MPRVSKTAADRQHLRLAKVLVGLVWLAIIALCLVHKDSFTLEGILTYTPDKPLLAALVLVVLFAVKSLSVFLYSGFLYMAAGALFPLPAAIAVNLAGTAVMVTLPYLLGQKLGGRAVEYILSRWPKAAALHDLRCDSDFFFVLLIRLLNVFSLDMVSAYMGAVGVKYRAYLPAGACVYVCAVSHYGREPCGCALTAVSPVGGHPSGHYAGVLHRLLPPSKGKNA